MSLNFPILSAAIIIPAFTAVLLLCTNSGKKPERVTIDKYIAILGAVLTLITTRILLLDFDRNHFGYQFVEFYSGLSSIGLDLHLGVDGISVFFIFLTALLSLICILISFTSVVKKVKEFLICFLILESLTIGVFSSLNLLLFYICFEAILIPMYLIIGIWGGPERIYASFKFFLYTLFGSILFLLVIIFLFQEFGTLSIPALTKLAPTFATEVQIYLWLASFLAFAVKVPMWPVHTWLPDAHVQAPTAGSVILAGILLKVGAYGFLRVSLPMLPDASIFFSPYVLALSALAVIYASLVAIAQTDMKKMIAYSSVAHMGYVTGGIFSFSSEGLSGAITQMISHGVVSSALFIVVGVLYDRLHTKEIAKYGGVASKMPVLASLFMVFVLAAVGLPGTSGFVGEFYSITAIFKANAVLGAISASGVIFGAIYMLRLYREVMLGEITNSEISSFKDLTKLELISLMPLAFLAILFGFYPSYITNIFAPEVTELVKLFQVGLGQ